MWVDGKFSWGDPPHRKVIQWGGDFDFHGGDFGILGKENLGDGDGDSSDGDGGGSRDNDGSGDIAGSGDSGDSGDNGNCGDAFCGFRKLERNASTSLVMVMTVVIQLMVIRAVQIYSF